jgi:cytochrome c biogenesis factor
MNYTFIILGIILLVIIYVLYTVFTEKKTTLESSKSLANKTFKYADLKNPGSPKYYISIWLYVRTNPDVETCVWKITESQQEVLGLYLDTSSNLFYKYNHTHRQDIMTGFPLQRWTHVILSVDSNKLIDTYVDGKLMKSHTVSLTQPTASSELIEAQDAPHLEAEIAGFERVPSVMDPKTAWQKYLAGNGGNAFSRFFKTWGISLVLTKDDVDQNTLSFPS